MDGSHTVIMQVIPAAREPDSWGDSQTTATVTRCSMSLIRGAGSMSAIEITHQDLSISQLRAEAARTADAKQARRILAIAMVLDGHSRLLAAQAGGMDRQTLRDWVIRYNTDGLAGLADRPRPGRQPRLAEAQRREVAKWVEDGPNLKTDGVVRWRCADLRERSVGKLLKKLNFSSMSGRPMHPQSDLEAQAAFKKTSPDWRAPQSRGSLPAGRSKSGFRMKPASASKPRGLASGRSAARVRGSSATGGSPGPTCSAPSARRAVPAPPSSCRPSASRPCTNIWPQSPHDSASVPS